MTEDGNIPDNQGFIRDHDPDGNHTPPRPQELVRWADVAQYHSDPLPAENHAPGGGTRPTVQLLNATPDPLGSLAALCGIYEGRVTRSLREVSDDQRREALAAMQATTLDGPLEVIQFHFLIEGVTRAFTHQAVRNRFSFFAQESMRFAVVDGENWVDRSAYPPSLSAAPVSSRELQIRFEHAETPEGIHPMEWESDGKYATMTAEEHSYAMQRDAWDDAIIVAQSSYQRLIEAGIPAEEARGLMPHAITTRYHWVVSLRTLLGEAGKRLCTQAQFEWRLVMAGIVKAIREYPSQTVPCPDNDDCMWPGRHNSHFLHEGCGAPWQFKAMADLLRPICYQEGKCGFMAKFDRGCKIRGRVEENAAIGRPSSEWDRPHYAGDHNPFECPDPDCTHPLNPEILPIRMAEWLADPAAARVRPGAGNG